MNHNSQHFLRLPAAYAVAYRVFLALALVSVLAEERAAAAPAAPESHSTIPLSFRPTADADQGQFSSSRMTVEVVLAPRDEAGLVTLLENVYNPNSPSYHQWLVPGEFNTRFAPSAAQIDAVAGFLQSSGLVVAQSSSPFLVRASGPSTVVEAAFGTTLRNYRNAKGIAYFSNASALRMPTSLASGVLGVVGLSNTVRVQAHAIRIPGNHANSTAQCETPYPTTHRLYEFYVNGISFPFGYGGGPGCSGLTPSQDNALYGAPELGPRGKGAGVRLAVYEFSAYQHSDIETWAHYFYGPGYTPPLVDVLVDGGPVNPICPADDTCPPGIGGYANDVEVDADIEMQLAIAPAASQLLVYEAPNDVSGQANLDLFAQIAQDDIADVISDSWLACESDVGAAFAQAENVFLEQIALQGQSFFSSAGDNGAYGCIATGTGVMVNATDPTTQPWVTSVGGTSFQSFNPAENPNPRYPDFVESVWNPDNLCSSQADVLGFPGYAWCGASDAGGGGISQFWGRPFYQRGPASRTRTRPTATAPRNAHSRQSERRAGRFRTYRRMLTSSRRTLSTAPGALPLPTVSALPSAGTRSRPAGSASEVRACHHRSGRRSSQTEMASGTAASAMRIRFSMRSTTSTITASSTTSLASGKNPTTTGCSPPPQALISRRVSAHPRWHR